MSDMQRPAWTNWIIQPDPLPEAAERGGRLYYPGLDGLRFIAALLVLLSHVPALPLGLSVLQKHGWVGVDIFLCISAFLIVKLLRTEYQRTGTILLKNFFIRRACRILPLYIGFASALSVGTIVFMEIDTRVVAGYWMSHVFLINNIVTAVEGYSPIPFTEHLWTISLEEQAYLLMPFLIFFTCLYNLDTSRVVRAALILLIFLVLARMCFIALKFEFPFTYTTLLRADAFILGGLAALMTEYGRVRSPLMFLLAGVGVIAVTLGVTGGIYKPVYQIFGYGLIGLGGFCIVLFAQSDHILARILGNWVLRYLGKISYGIYVYHLVCLGLTKEIVPDPGQNAVMTLIITLALTISVSAASYAFFEKRALRLRERFIVIQSRSI